MYHQNVWSIGELVFEALTFISNSYNVVVKQTVCMVLTNLIVEEVNNKVS